jgi:UDP-glucose 4-epimerase
MSDSQHALITGGMGFVGSHLAEALLAAGHRVTVLDDLSTGRTDNLAHLSGHERLRCVLGDVTDRSLLAPLVGESDVVYHLAAAVGVRLIVEEPVRSLETNLLGTEAVLEVASQAGAKVLLASTSEVYGKSDRVPFREDDDVMIGPTIRNRWAYAAAKMVDEFLALAYHQQRGLPVVIFRLFNTVGPRQTGRYGMVVPRFVAAALRGEPLTVYGDGLQSRCFLHVRDAVEAITGLAACPQAVGQVFNVGSTEQVTIRELAERVLRHVQGTAPAERITTVPYDQAYPSGFEDIRVRVPDTSRLRDLTGWQPSRDLERIIQDVVDSVRQEAGAL